MAGDRLTRPGRAFLGRRRVADGEDEIHDDRDSGCWNSEMCLDRRPEVSWPLRFRISSAKGFNSVLGRVPAEKAWNLPLPRSRKQCLGKDRAGRVARADEKHVEIGVGDVRVHLGGVLWGGEQGGKEIGPGTTHIEGEVADQSLGRVEIDGVEERPADPRDLHKARCGQVGQMVRQRVLLHPKRLGDLGRPHALRGKAHQEAKDRHPAGMAECGEGMGSAILFHISRLKEIICVVQ